MSYKLNLSFCSLTVLVFHFHYIEKASHILQTFIQCFKCSAQGHISHLGTQLFCMWLYYLGIFVGKNRFNSFKTKLYTSHSFYHWVNDKDVWNDDNEKSVLKCIQLFRNPCIHFGFICFWKAIQQKCWLNDLIKNTTWCNHKIMK